MKGILLCPYGRLRWGKAYPEVFRWLGWCSWNTYYHAVSQQKVLDSVRSLRDRRIPVGFVLVDDGWLTIQESRLAGFDADHRHWRKGPARPSRRRGSELLCGLVSPLERVGDRFCQD